MMLYIVKVAVSTTLIVLVSEISKRSTLWGSLLVSLPLVSLLSIFWLYYDTRDTSRVAQLSTSIFWLVLPSLVFFLIFPVLLRKGHGFYPSLGIALGTMLAAYLTLNLLLKQLGVKL